MLYEGQLLLEPFYTVIKTYPITAVWALTGIKRF